MRPLALSLLLVFCAAGETPAAARLTFRVAGDAGEPLPCRVHLKDAAGQPQRARGLPFWRDHFVCPGEAELELPAGEYTYQVERGPEYRRQTGTVELEDAAEETIEIRLRRLTNLAQKGWYSGDLHVHRPPEDVPLLMRAEDLHMAPVITWWINRGGIRNLWDEREPPAKTLKTIDEIRHYDVMAGEDEREGGALLYFHLNRPLAVDNVSAEYPSPLKYVAAAHDDSKNVWIDIEKPFWWDVPVWLAEGTGDSIGLANNHMCHSRMYESEAWGRPRDVERLPAPRGNGFWSQEIYYHILNSGLRIPPSAGSASGVLPNPVGYNRVYVHVGEGDSNYQQWWEGLRMGRSFVTNGPLLICRADGKLPGHVFRGAEGNELKIELNVRLESNDRVPAIEVIQNGRVALSVPQEEIPAGGGLGSISFRKSGWFLVRGVTDNPRTFRFASTAPYYVEIGPDRRRISRRSAEFFLDWTRRRIRRVGMKLNDPEKLEQVLRSHRRAEDFWRERVQRANAD